MKIVIEAFALSQERLTGVGYVVLNYLNCLQKLDADNTYFVFSMDPLVRGSIAGDRWNSLSFDNMFSKARKWSRRKWEQYQKKRNHLIQPIYVIWFRVLKILFETLDELVTSLQLVSFIKRERIDVYVGTSTYYYPLLFVSRVKKTAIVYDLVWKFFPETMELGNRIRMTLLTMYNMRRMDALIAISENTKSDIIRILNITKPVIAIPLAADKNIFHVPTSSQISSILKKYRIPRKYILSVCTLEPRKNIKTLIQAFEKMKARHDYSLVLVGMTGWKQSEFLSSLTETAIKERIIFTGYVPDADLAALYGGASIFVYPSLYEGFGLPVLEAMQCACPVITSSTSSIPEVVGNAAIMVDPYKVNDLVNALDRVLADGKLRKTLKNNGLRRAKQFSWESSTNDLIGVFNALTHGDHHAS